jgi:hypothetical protein
MCSHALLFTFRRLQDVWGCKSRRLLIRIQDASRMHWRFSCVSIAPEFRSEGDVTGFTAFRR